MTFEYGFTPTISLRLSLEQWRLDEPEKRNKFPMEVDGLEGKEKVDVYFVNKGEVDSFGEVREQGIFLSRGLNPALVPILVQMLFSQSLGYAKEATRDAAVLFGNNVLKSEDFVELASLIGANIALPTEVAERDGSQEHYLKAYAEYGVHFRRNKWIALARAYQACGAFEESAELGRGVIIAKRILEEEAVVVREADGKKVEKMPAIRDVLPKVVGLLECVNRTLDEHEKDSHGAIALGISEPTLLRVLQFFSEEFVNNSPIVFKDDGSGKNESVVEFGSGSGRLIASTVKHIRVDLQKEEQSIAGVLTAATKRYGELTEGGASYRAMLGITEKLKPEEIREAMAKMEKLGDRRRYLKSAIVGERQKIPRG